MRIKLYPLKSLIVYSPQVYTLTLRLNKQSSSAPCKLSLRNPNFSPYSLVEGLSDHLIGSPLRFLGGQTHGLKLKAGEWTPRVVVYGDDPMGSYFELESGGFSSTFKSSIKPENPKQVLLRG